MGPTPPACFLFSYQPILLRQTLAQLIQLHVEILLRMNHLVDIRCDQFAFYDTAGFAGISLDQLAHGKVAETAGQNAVVMRRRTAALNVTKHGYARLNPITLRNAPSDVLALAHAFRYDNDTVSLAVFEIFGHSLRYLIQIIRHLRNKNRFGSARQTCIQGNITAMSAHDLYNRGTLVRAHRVAKLIDGVYNDANRRIEPDRKVGKRNVVIDRTQRPHRLDAELAQLVCPLVRAVAADDHQTVDAVLTEIFRTQSAGLPV